MYLQWVNNLRTVYGSCHIIDFIMDVPVSYTLVVDGGVMLCMVISIVRIIWTCSFLPIYFEMQLIFPGSQPEVPHIPRFCLFNYDVIVGVGLSGGIVSFNWSLEVEDSPLRSDSFWEGRLFESYEISFQLQLLLLRPLNGGGTCILHV